MENLKAGVKNVDCWGMAVLFCVWGEVRLQCMEEFGIACLMVERGELFDNN